MNSSPFFWLVIAGGGAVVLGKNVWEKWQGHRCVEIANQAHALSEQGKRYDAIALLEAFLRRSPFLPIVESAPPRLMLASLYQAEERFTDSEAQCRWALSRLPEHTPLAAQTFTTDWATRSMHRAKTTNRCK